MPNEELGSFWGAQHLLSSFVPSFCSRSSIFSASSSNGTPSFPAFSVPLLSTSPLTPVSLFSLDQYRHASFNWASQVLCLYQLKARPLPTKVCPHYLITRFIVKFALLQWSGTKPTIILEVCLYLEVFMLSLSLIPGRQIPS